MATNRTHTRVLAVVHSHLRDEPIHLSPDIMSIKTAKSTKTAGTLSVELVPRSNYLNLIFPNDTINVYVDPGDQKSGFIRLFMGYVDRIERIENTDDKGAITTSIRLACSDFQKVFEKTILYVNPHLTQRQDLLDQKIGMSMLGGTGLRTLGLFASGSPAEIVENTAHMILGFGTQWALPPSYGNAAHDKIEDNRKRRKHRSLTKIPSSLLSGLSAMVGDLDEALKAVDNGAFDELEDFVVRSNISNKTATEEESKFTVDTFATTEVLAQFKEGKQSLRAYKTVLESAEKGKLGSFLDLLDFSFIEAASIDGNITSTAIWDKSGPVLSAMRNFSNDIVNELIFDLRPVAAGSDVDGKFLDSCFGGEYSTNKDELGYNKDGWPGGKFGSNTDAVQYAPAIVFREYPYSCVQGFDMGGLRVLDKEPIGFVPFGPIYSVKNNTGNGRYRAIYDYNDVKEIADNTIAVSNKTCEFEETHAPLKHLDVVNIYDSDVISSSVGRSDRDVFNLFTMSAQDPLQSIYKYLLNYFMPITSAVSIARNGVRPREISTRFANHGKRVICQDGEDITVESGVVRNMIRWLLLQDHWDQHNHELLSGTIMLRGMPEIRVGYRLDWEDRRESYYVENVSHAYSFGKEMVTTLQVSRGMRNDPFLSYIPPKTGPQAGSSGISGNIFGGNRNTDGRLAKYFEVLDTPSSARATQTREVRWSPYSDDINFYDDISSADQHGDGTFGNKIIYAGQDLPLAGAGRGLASFAIDLFTKATQKKEADTPVDGASIPSRPTQEKISRIARNVRKKFDDDFERIGGPRGLPVEFLRALGKKESSLDPNDQIDPAWGLLQVGVDGFPGISGKSGKVLISYNERKGTTFKPKDMLDADKNIEVATELLGRIITAHNKAGLATNWNSEHWVGLLVAGWNAGWSWKRGTAGCITWMVNDADPSVEPTIDNMVSYIPQIRSEGGRDISNFLLSTTKRGWWKGVVKQYFHEKSRG